MSKYRPKVYTAERDQKTGYVCKRYTVPANSPLVPTLPTELDEKQVRQVAVMNLHGTLPIILTDGTNDGPEVDARDSRTLPMGATPAFRNSSASTAVSVAIEWTYYL